MNLWQQFKTQGTWQPFDTYRVTVRLRDLVGGAPKNEQMLDGWINATNKEKSDEERRVLIEASRVELPDLSDEKAAKNSIGFKQDGRGLYIEGRQVKAMLKEAGNVIKEIAPGASKTNEDETGVTALKKKISEQIFVLEEKIYLDRQKPDAIEDHAIHVMTAQGPRTSIKRVEIVRECQIAFTIKRRIGNAVSEKILLATLDYAQNLGLGADRSQGRGVFEVLSVEKIVQV